MAVSNVIGLLLYGGVSGKEGEGSGIARVVRKAATDLEAYCLKVVVSNHRSQFKDQGCAGIRQLHDRVEFTGPAAGLVTALEAFPGRSLLVLGAKYYSRAAQIAEQLLAVADDSDVVVCCEGEGGNPDPFAALIRPGFAEVLSASLDRGDRDVAEVIQQLCAEDVKRAGPLPSVLR